MFAYAICIQSSGESFVCWHCVSCRSYVRVGRLIAQVECWHSSVSEAQCLKAHVAQRAVAGCEVGTRLLVVEAWPSGRRL